MREGREIVKIIATVRTRNEARNIGRFCEAYSWTDLILIADGGSDDTTLDIARTYPNVKVDLFTQKVEQNGLSPSGDPHPCGYSEASQGLWRNPYGLHINFLIDWAKAEGADWIIFDDCDCVPTRALQQDARGLLADTPQSVIALYRLYIWGYDSYFPRQNEPGQSLWAWRVDKAIRASEADPWQHTMVGWTREDELRLEPPHTCLHYFCPDEATTQRKLNFYRDSGEQAGAVHPLTSCGPLELLPAWARWK